VCCFMEQLTIGNEQSLSEGKASDFYTRGMGFESRLNMLSGFSSSS